MIKRCPWLPNYLEYENEIDKALKEVLISGQYILGDNVLNFEKEFSSYVNCKYGIGVNSGTDALILSLRALNLPKGSEIITTPFTFYATYAAIREVNAIPIFVDIDPKTFLLDLNQIKKAITSHTKAIIPVHLFGNAVDIRSLRKIIGNEIYIIEDAAQAHGAKVNDEMVGSLGDIAAFSFYPSKNLGGYGDGGMVTTNNKEIADKIKKLRMYGMVEKDVYIGDGINSRLDEIQAAILRVKLKYLDKMNNKRKKLAHLYSELLNPEFVIPQCINANVTAVYRIYSVLCNDDRDEFVNYLKLKDIQTNVYYPKTIDKQKGYTDFYKKRFELPVARDIAKRIISLPFYSEIEEDNIHYITETINSFFAK